MPFSDRELQAKRSSVLAFRNRWRLAKEHAELVSFIREVFGEGLAQPNDPVVAEMARGLLKEIDKP